MYTFSSVFPEKTSNPVESKLLPRKLYELNNEADSNDWRAAIFLLFFL